MRRILLITVLSLLPLTQLFAGRIFGNIMMGDKPLADSVLVTVGVPGKVTDAAKAPAVVPADSTRTKDSGSYRLNVKEEGKCVLTVHVDKQTPTLEVFSYANATRYDILIEKGKDGKYTLKRK